MILHALFDDSAHGDAALSALRDAGLAGDAPEVHRDRLYHTPHAGQSAVPMWFLGGATLIGGAGAVLGFVLASMGLLGLSVPPLTAAAFLGLAGGSLGGLSSALGGAGAFRSDYYKAAQGMTSGQVLLTVNVPWAESDQALTLLGEHGALNITQVAG
ncbi:MAG: hypothetical protein KDA24_23685 [Deltaproteobacteria bacterium]|nr:hypothetical protein [Deltaproteobacteria bacterium]